MARYPTFEEYEAKSNWKDGIERCNGLLKKHPTDVQLLAVKLRLLGADEQDGTPVLDQLLAIAPPIRDLGELLTVNAAVVASQRSVWPRPKTVGPEMAKLWENALKASTSARDKVELSAQRFECSIESDYMVDAQQALIQLKPLQRKDRAIYMAHAAVTQLISTSNEDLHARLALSLAKKAVSEKFDEDGGLDCRVPGQIFALQGSRKDLDTIKGTRFGESKQVFEAVRSASNVETNGSLPTTTSPDPTDVPPTEWLSTEIGVLKEQFSRLIESSAGTGAILRFAASAIRLFHTAAHSLKSAHSRAKGDACFVAISALVRAYELSQQLHHLLIAARLAEILLELDEHIHEARLISVYLYMRLGLGSLAVRDFDSLSIKEMQFDTVGHVLFTNLSYTYPHQLPFGRKEERNPLSRAKNAVQVYKRCEDKLADNEASVLSTGQSGMLLDLHELRDDLRSSMTKRIIVLEVRRQARLVADDSSWHTQDLGPRCLGNWTDTTDNRDFAATFDYGYSVEKALYSQDGRLPSKDWILYGLVADVAWCLAKSKVADCPVKDVDAILEHLVTDSRDIGRLTLSDGDVQRPAVSEPQYLVGRLAVEVIALVMLVRSKATAAELQYTIAGVEAAVSRLSIDALCETADAFTERLQDHYMYFDILKTTNAACVFAQGENKECVDDLQQVRQKVQGDMAALKKHAERQRRAVGASDIEAAMAKGKDAYEAVAAFGEGGLQSFCASIETSARDGWAGLSKLKE